MYAYEMEESIEKTNLIIAVNRLLVIFFLLFLDESFEFCRAEISSLLLRRLTD